MELADLQLSWHPIASPGSTDFTNFFSALTVGCHDPQQSQRGAEKEPLHVMETR